MVLKASQLPSKISFAGQLFVLLATITQRRAEYHERPEKIMEIRNYGLEKLISRYSKVFSRSKALFLKTRNCCLKPGHWCVCAFFRTRNFEPTIFLVGPSHSIYILHTRVLLQMIFFYFLCNTYVGEFSGTRTESWDAAEQRSRVPEDARDMAEGRNCPALGRSVCCAPRSSYIALLSHVQFNFILFTSSTH